MSKMFSGSYGDGYDPYRDGLITNRGPLPTYTPEEEACLKDRKWWAFLLSSIFTFLAGIFIVLLYRLVEFLFSGILFGGGASVQQGTGSGTPGQPGPKPAAVPQAPHQKHQELLELSGEASPPPAGSELGWMNEAKDWAGELISGQSTTGRILVVLVFLLSIASLVIYFIDASK